MCGRVPVATISEGPVQGYVESGTGNHVYLGVPFSATTAGQNRWKAPAPVAKRSSVFNATEYGHSCPQGSLSAILAPQGEDCLNLNIWAPSSGKGHNVMVFIFGGAMVTGGNSLATYNGTFFPADDVVLVTLNYRSNMFGAPHSPELSGTSANFGILDVFAGIAWVQKNIAAFGGDPAQITIFGQSSGGVMVDYYLWNHPNTTIKAAIIESATVFSGPNYAPEGVGLDAVSAEVGCPNGTASGQHADPSAAEGVGLDAVSAEVGCPNGTAHGQLDCLRGKSLSELLTANFNATYATWFTPTIDEITRLRDYPARFRAGKFAKHVPAMLGNVDAEGTLFGEIVYPAVEEDPFSFWINTYDADAAHIVDYELLLHYSLSNYSSARIMAGDLYANLRFYWPSITSMTCDPRSRRRGTTAGWATSPRPTWDLWAPRTELS